MKKIPINKIFIILLVLIASTSIAPLVFGVELEVNYPAVGPDGSTPFSGGGPLVWVQYIFYFGLIITGIAAVGSLIYAGILWMTSESSGKIQEARARIWAAILGIIIVAGSVIILRTINPDLVSLSPLNEVKNKIFYNTYQYSELCRPDEYYDPLRIGENCVPKLPDGDPCRLNIQCKSNSCKNGICETSILASCSPINAQGGCPSDQWCGPTSLCIIKRGSGSECGNLHVMCLSGECNPNTGQCKKGRGESCNTNQNECAFEFSCRLPVGVKNPAAGICT